MMSSHPNKWKTPEWHPDFGNPEIEVTMLRNFCMELIKLFPEVKYNLIAPEEGYVYLDFMISPTKHAELYVVDDDNKGKRYGLFILNAKEEEYYFVDHKKGLNYLSKFIE